MEVSDCDLEIFQRLVDSIFERIPTKYAVESVARVAGEKKVIIHIKPVNPEHHFADISKMMMEIKVE